MEQYEEHITPEATQATVPEEIHPVAAAFGGDIGQALEAGGKEVASRIENLSLHLSRMQYYQQQAQIQDKMNGLKNWSIDKTYNPNNLPNVDIPKTWQAEALNPNTTPLSAGTPGASDALNPQGKSGTQQSDVTPDTVNVPYGIYQRTGWQAAGAGHDYDTSYQAYKDQIIQQSKQEGFGSRAMLSLTRSLDNFQASERTQITKHEATQRDSAIGQIYMNGLQATADTGGNAQDPASLALKINDIVGNNKEFNDQQMVSSITPEGKVLRQSQEDKFVGQLLNNSITQSLKENGDPTKAQNNLDTLHDKGVINDTVYNSASKTLGEQYDAQQKQVERGQKIQQINGRMNLISQLAQGKITLSSKNAIDALSQNDQPLAQAINDNVLKSSPDLSKEDNQSYADLAKTIFSSNNKEDISNALMDAVKANTAGKFSQDHLNILVNAAADKGKDMADLKDDQPKSNPLRDAYDAGMKVLFGTNANEEHPDMNTLTNYIKNVNDKMPPSDALQKAKGDGAVVNNPYLANLPPNGNIFRDPKTGVRMMVLPPTKEIPYIHTEAISAPKTKESNGNSND